MKTIFSLIVVLSLAFMVYEKNKTSIINEVKNVTETIESGGGTNQNSNNTQEVVEHSQEAINYFGEVCEGFEYSSNKQVMKWDTDVKVYVRGQKPDYLMAELESIVDELNSYINPIDIKFVNSESDANFVVMFSSASDYVSYEPFASSYVAHNWGMFVIAGNTSIVRASMYVDIVRCSDIDGQKHLLREEFTQGLGLKNDSNTYPESMFYQGWTTTTEYAPIDVEIIKMLYNE
jgi:hypothetical protein